jgi:hypothetical protein
MRPPPGPGRHAGGGPASGPAPGPGPGEFDTGPVTGWPGSPVAVCAPARYYYFGVVPPA